VSGHVISILTFGNRALATCSCAGRIGRERFGDSCVKTAKIDGEAHLAKTKLEPQIEKFTGWEKSSLGYFAALETLSVEEECPICRTSMNLEPGSLDEVQCPQGHLFTLQIEGDVAGLFPDRNYPIVHQSAGIKEQGYGFNLEEEPVVCPFDGASFTTGFAGLPQYLEDFVVICEEGHEFVAYKDDVVVTLFFDNQDGPFETTYALSTEFPSDLPTFGRIVKVTLPATEEFPEESHVGRFDERGEFTTEGEYNSWPMDVTDATFELLEENPDQGVLFSSRKTANFNVGDVFTHPTMLDTDWTPGPGQKYKDGPNAKCKVTRVANGVLYYGILDVNGELGGHFKTTQDALDSLMQAYGTNKER